MLEVWSGCQIGVDFIGLELAEEFGFKTSGFVTKENRREDGKRPDLIKRFNLKELDSYYYKDRTYANVEHADGTLLITANPDSPGTKCTIRAIEKYNKPHYYINCLEAADWNFDVVEDLLDWIKSTPINVLNVAGSRVGADEFTYKLLTYIFNKIKDESSSFLPKT